MTTKTLAMVAVAMLAVGVVWAEPTPLPIPNGGFEDGAEGWSITEFEGVTSAITDEQAASGKYSLKVVDTHPKNGSSVKSGRVPISGAGVYELRGMLFPVSGEGLGMYVRVCDKDGKLVVSGETFQKGLGGSAKAWRPFRLPVYTPEDAATLEVWVHSYSHANVEAYLDDLEFVDLGMDGLQPPWEGQYKIRPEETDRLTPADVVGPDGIVYPDWTRCGVQGGIPQVGAATTIEDHGGKADDDLDDSQALDQACVAAGEAGGGAVILGEGTYILDRPVTVRHDGVVIRGQGAGKTKLIFTYAVPDNGVGFYTPSPGSRVGKATRIEMHCAPTDLMAMTMSVDDVVVKQWARSLHSGNSFATYIYGSSIVGKLPDGAHTLKGVAEYKDGSTKTGEMPIVLDSKYADTRLVPSSIAAINFAGRGLIGPKVKLARDGKRGETVLELERTGGLAAGDWVMIDGPATERWKALTQNACEWGNYRRNLLRIDAMEGNTITLSQPLRIEFPAIDGSYVQKVGLIEGCGIEDLYIEQTENLWITTTVFSYAVNCWGRGVTVRMCGRNPLYGSMAKWCEIRDCVFDDAWFKGGGGTAYTGWEHSYDCLMDGIETFKMRHAPLFQWAASGCVIRNGLFHDSDGQWHSGWTNENLFENCVITSTSGNGGYGHGFWGSPPEDTAHGPNGPRNVIYNCDVTCEKDGLWMGGMNENWLILHNRFIMETGRGVLMKTASFDHIIKGNVFVASNDQQPMAFIVTPDCIGVELIGNKLYGGNGKFADGLGKPAVVEGNEALPFDESAPRPTPAVPSIYEWQQQNAGK